MDRPDPKRKGIGGMMDFISEAIDWMDEAEAEIQRLRDEIERRKKMSRSTTRLVAKYRKALELKEGSILRDTE